jgi:predicted TIM-barrel fold metal-dependent hydrolase
MEFFSRLMDCFGASPMMWGSNFTATNRQPQSGAA